MFEYQNHKLYAEFAQLLKDDTAFANMYDDTNEDFHAWAMAYETDSDWQEDTYTTKCDMHLTWNDGAKEVIGFLDLPEYLQDEIRTYLVEVEQLRNEDKTAYDNEYIRYSVKNRQTGQILTDEQIIAEVNRDRSDEWLVYTIDELKKTPHEVLYWIDDNYYEVTE
jgi:hypothetical protein